MYRANQISYSIFIISVKVLPSCSFESDDDNRLTNRKNLLNTTSWRNGDRPIDRIELNQSQRLLHIILTKNLNHSKRNPCKLQYVLQECDRNPFRRRRYGKHGIRIGVPRQCQRSESFTLWNWTILLPCDRPLPQTELRIRKQKTTNGPHGPTQH